jgi:hypothetical protein
MSAAIADVAAAIADAGYYRRCRLLSPTSAVVALISVVMSATVTDVCYCRCHYYR